MDQLRTAPPAEDSCLIESYSSRGTMGQKGGTRICEAVVDLATHEARMENPASYRPAECRCGCARLHLHGLRERKLRSGGGLTVVTVVVFRCAECRATWRVLPAFVARCLWRKWAVVATAVGLSPRRAGEPQVPQVPGRTRRRWRQRLALAALVPMQVLASSGEAVLRAVAQAVGLEGRRRALVDSFAVAFPGTAPLATLAELLHRLSPGIRLM